MSVAPPRPGLSVSFARPRSGLTVTIGSGLHRGDIPLIGLAAGLLSLAQPPFGLLVPAFVCLIPAGLLILRGSRADDSRRRLLHQGFWYGTVTHAVLLHWLAWAMWGYRPVAVVLYPVAAVMFGGAYAVVFAAVGAIARDAPRRLLLALPLGVIGLEWVAAHAGLLAFPWYASALTVSSSALLIQAADLAGAEGLGLVVVFVNAALALAMDRRGDPPAVLAYVAAAGLAISLLGGYGAYRLDTLPLTAGPVVAVVQPNASVREKWAPHAQDALVDRTLRLTEEALAASGAEMVVWPETALPDGVSRRPDWVSRVDRLARRSRSTLVVGGVDGPASSAGPPSTSTTAGWAANTASAFPANGVFAFPSRAGPPRPIYRKRRLVPLVERTIPGMSGPQGPTPSGFRPGRRAGVASSPLGRYGTLLCFELTFAPMARSLRRRGADVLVTLSNDAWLGRTVAPHQHFAHARLRAVETRSTVVRAANTGVSGIIDPLGRVVVRTPTFVETHASGRIQRSEARPLAIRLGDWTGPVALTALLGMLLLRARPRYRPPHAPRR